MDSPKLPLTNVRSYNSTITGAVTITSLLAMPRRQVTTDSLNHGQGLCDSAPRMKQYKVSK